MAALWGRTLLALLAAGPLAGAAAAPAQDAVRVRRVALVVGRDTIALERVTRAPGRLEGELLNLLLDQHWHYTASLAPTGLVLALTHSFRLGSDPAAAPPRHEVRLAFEGSGVTVAATSGPTVHFGAGLGALPYLSPSVGLVELLEQRRRALGVDSVEIPLFQVSGGPILVGRVQRFGRDSVLVWIGRVAIRLAVSDSGEVLGGEIPSQQMKIVRTGPGPIVEPPPAPRPGRRRGRSGGQAAGAAPLHGPPSAEILRGAPIPSHGDGGRTGRTLTPWRSPSSTSGMPGPARPFPSIVSSTAPRAAPSPLCTTMT